METSAIALQQRLDNENLTHAQRLHIGQRLADFGDPRPGTGVSNGLPDILWLPVAPGGEVLIQRIWRAETPDEETRVIQTETVDVDPFHIGQFLVTQRQFQAFVDAKDGFEQLDWWRGMPPAAQRQPLSASRAQLSNEPRDSISWWQAVAFARWLDHRLTGLELAHPGGAGRVRVGDDVQVRLPTEWEWQWAAQNGEEARTFPWGDRKTGLANTAEAGLGQATAVGVYPRGKAACGAVDMAGNLMEWCANDKANLDIVEVTSDASKALRGGDWGYDLRNATCAYCDDEDPSRIDPLNGCRLVIGKKVKGMA
ncbi:MAG: formylglycine-generating enzyme family protein [Caldilineaceae bacterium]|nr:formylglycine-generating enzyme family protein [Caldilineaceae bacterium]